MAEPNPVLNSGFEELTEAKPNNWNIDEGIAVLKPGDTDYLASPDGGNYLNMPVKGKFAKQQVNLTGGKRYQVSFWLKYAPAVDVAAANRYSAQLSIYCYNEANENNAGFDQSFYNTRNEWRRVGRIFTMPSDGTHITINLRSMLYDNASLSFDGVEVREITDDGNILLGGDMDDVTNVSVNSQNVTIPAFWTVRGPYNPSTDSDKANRGALGVNYLSSTDTRTGSGYSFKMTNDGAVSTNLLSFIHLNVIPTYNDISAFTLYEVSGYVKIESGTGSARAYASRYYANNNTSGGDMGFTDNIFSTKGTWQKFSFPMMYYRNDGTEATTIPVVMLQYTGTGSVLWDDIKVTPAKNLAINGDCEAIKAANSGGNFTPSGFWSKSSSTGVAWVAADGYDSEGKSTTADGAYLTNYKPHSGNYSIKVDTNDGGAFWAELSGTTLKPGRTYRFSYWQKDAAESVSSNNTRIQIEATAANVYFYPNNTTQTSNTYQVYVYNPGVRGTDEWVQHEMYFKIPETGCYTRPTIRFRMSSEGGNIYYLDDVELYEVSDGFTVGHEFYEGTLLGKTITPSNDGNVVVKYDYFASNPLTKETVNLLAAVYEVNEQGKKLVSVNVVSGTTDNVLRSDLADYFFSTPAQLMAQVEVPSDISKTYTVEAFLINNFNDIKPIGEKVKMTK